MKRIVMIIMAALIALPTMAQDWQSTSSMQTSGSAYSSQVTAVGATGVSSMATTTESYSPAKAPSGPRKNSSNDPWGTNKQDDNADEAFPVGDAMLPLLLMAAGFGLYTALRRRKKTA